MIQKNQMILPALLAGFLLLAGCSRQTEQISYIGLDEAKNRTLAEAGLSADAVTFTTAAMGSRDGLDYYELVFTCNGESYEYDVDALTGIIIASQTPETIASQSLVSLANADTDVSAVSVQSTIPADSSAAAAIPDSTPAATDTGRISAEEAKDIALNHAGLSASEVTFAKQKLDHDDGRPVYEIKFYTDDNAEFDYEIDAATGLILSYDYEASFHTVPTADTGSGTISEDQAKAIALAQVPGAAASDIRKFKLDHDDGRKQYEGTILYDGMKYEFEIDAYSGAIRDWEAEFIH